MAVRHLTNWQKMTGKIILVSSEIFMTQRLPVTYNFGNPDLSSPPVTPAQLTTKKKAFDDARVAAATGGPAQTALKNTAKADLVDELNKDASYTDYACNGDLDVLISSGFEPVSTNRTPVVLNAPRITGVKHYGTGKLKAGVVAQRGVKSFVGRIKASNGTEFGPNLSFKNSRAIIFDGLTAGLTYVLQLCAIGGANGQTDWSDPASHMAM
jgi:hypothetical protein